MSNTGRVDPSLFREVGGFLSLDDCRGLSLSSKTANQLVREELFQTKNCEVLTDEYTDEVTLCRKPIFWCRGWPSICGRCHTHNCAYHKINCGDCQLAMCRSCDFCMSCERVGCSKCVAKLKCLGCARQVCATAGSVCTDDWIICSGCGKNQCNDCDVIILRHCEECGKALCGECGNRAGYTVCEHCSVDICAACQNQHHCPFHLP